MNAILFGFKGCGKTYLGKLLAKKLNRQFIDTDDVIVRLHAEKSGQYLTPRAIYQSLGSVSFRSLEKQALYSLEGVHNAVIALGGGAVLNPENVETLQKIGTLIYLEASLETINSRNITHVEGPIDKLYYERLPIYRSISAPCIHVDIIDESTVLKVISNLEKITDGF